MTVERNPGRATAAAGSRIRDFWEYYRRYTKTGAHAAATAALTAFGLLVFIDSLFAWLAIASYLLPPIVLYGIGDDAGDDRPTVAKQHDSTDRIADAEATSATDGSADLVGPDIDGPDRDHDGVDRDVDGPDRDADGADLDVDGPDADSDGPDADADGRDTDGDSRWVP